MMLLFRSRVLFSQQHFTHIMKISENILLVGATQPSRQLPVQTLEQGVKYVQS